MNLYQYLGQFEPCCVSNNLCLLLYLTTYACCLIHNIRGPAYVVSWKVSFSKLPRNDSKVLCIELSKTAYEKVQRTWSK